PTTPIATTPDPVPTKPIATTPDPVPTTPIATTPGPVPTTPTTTPTPDPAPTTPTTTPTPDPAPTTPTTTPTPDPAPTTSIPTPQQLACSVMSVGQGAGLNGFLPFAANDPWRQNIAGAPVDGNSSGYISYIGNSRLYANFGAGLYDG